MAKGIISWGEIAERLPLLIVECRTCGRRGQYHTAKLVEKYGAESTARPTICTPPFFQLRNFRSCFNLRSDGSIAQFQDDITKDCPKRNDLTIALGHGCAPLCPQLSEVF